MSHCAGEGHVIPAGGRQAFVTLDNSNQDLLQEIHRVFTDPCLLSRLCHISGVHEATVTREN